MNRKELIELRGHRCEKCGMNKKAAAFPPASAVG